MHVKSFVYQERELRCNTRGCVVQGYKSCDLLYPRMKAARSAPPRAHRLYSTHLNLSSCHAKHIGDDDLPGKDNILNCLCCPQPSLEDSSSDIGTSIRKSSSLNLLWWEIVLL